MATVLAEKVITTGRLHRVDFPTLSRLCRKEPHSNVSFAKVPQRDAFPKEAGQFSDLLTVCDTNVL